MSHELTMRRSGQVEMAYTGAQPWHGLGTLMLPEATVPEWVEGAGMDWKIEKAPVQYSYRGVSHTVTDRSVLHRSDTGHPLGVVSSGYQVVQPAETIEFFADLIQSLGLRLATAGTLFGGRRYWATGYIGEDAIVDRRDVVRGYLLLSSSADGSLATTGRFTSVRVVCNNTLGMAMSGARAAVVIPHSTRFDAASAKRQLGLAPKAFETFMMDMRRLATVPVTNERAAELTKTLTESEGAVSQRIMALFGGEAAGDDYEGSGGTAWGWLNAVTQFIDHDRKAKSDSHRLNSALFGRGELMKMRARDLALA